MTANKDNTVVLCVCTCMCACVCVYVHIDDEHKVESSHSNKNFNTLPNFQIQTFSNLSQNLLPEQMT